jgi:predicted RNase H-like HicB family nuclease
MPIKTSTLENRVELVEKELKGLSARMTRIEALCQEARRMSVSVPISTFAPEPFEIIRDFSVVVQPEEDGFVATLFDANISSSGETQEEAVANVKDLILMIFKGFEHEDDRVLGPAMIRQKHALLSLIRRKS